MNLETFFEKFDLFADCPNAVQRMRELILELAVQGKLVEQDEADDDARLLLNEIYAEKVSQANKSKNISTDGLEVNGPFGLPIRWVWTQLGLIALNIQYGYTASADPLLTEYRMLRITDIQNNQVNWDGVPGCLIESVEAEKYLLSENDILIARTGGTIGKSFIVPNAPVKSVFASYLIRVKPPASVDARYLKIFLETPMYWAQLKEMSAGTGQPNVNGQALGRLILPLPPLAEQKRIVAKVDELMALCDALEAQQKEREIKRTALAKASLAAFAEAPSPQSLELLFHPSYVIDPADLRKSILTLAVQGKLVEQREEDGDATLILDRITKEKAKKILAKEIRASKVSKPATADDAPISLPNGWVWTNVDSLCFKVTDGTHFTPRYAESGVRFVSAKDVTGGVLSFDKCKFITQEEHDQLYRRCNPEYMDIVISKSGSIGTVALIEDRNEFSLFESLALLKYDQTGVFSAFFVYALRNACSTLTSGHIRGVGVKHLHLDILRSLELALPPLAEQKRIVAKVDELMALVDRLEAKEKAARDTASRLLEAMVAELSGRVAA